MNGQNFTLPLEMLDAKSMRQAFIFSQKATTQLRKPLPTAPAIPVAPSPPPLSLSRNKFNAQQNRPPLPCYFENS